MTDEEQAEADYKQLEDEAQIATLAAVVAARQPNANVDLATDKDGKIIGASFLRQDIYPGMNTQRRVPNRAARNALRGRHT